MTIERIGTRICKQCGASFTHTDLVSDNNFFGKLASSISNQSGRHKCLCGSADFFFRNDFDPIVLRSIDDLELSIPISVVLKKAGVYYIGDLVSLGDESILALPDFSPEFLREIRESLASRGMELGGDLPGWPPPGF